MEKHLKVYVAGRYGRSLTASERARNMADADLIARQIATRGHIPFVPHKNSYGWDAPLKKDGCLIEGCECELRYPEVDRVTTLVVDFEHLLDCDAFIRVPGHESKLIDAEEAIARIFGLRILWDVNALPLGY